ncbi:MAG TPA: hypothetical protein VHC69_11015 [Polyangiaceae bacterium]|nr:hypothetical protein [Polyangiaceae bacterium]
MNRALWLLPVPLAAIALAVLAPHDPARKPAASPETPAEPGAVTTAPTWVATKIPPRPPRTALPSAAPKASSGPKPMTQSREALLDSRPPIVATLSVDQLGSPRERLLAAQRVSEARQAQLDRLSDRTARHLEKLKAERAEATGEERAHLTRTIQTLEKNQSLRGRVMKPTVHVPARPGTQIAGLDVPVSDKSKP